MRFVLEEWGRMIEHSIRNAAHQKDENKLKQELVMGKRGR